jgi:diguanylate cyclase (GGDEF)-like protein
MTSPDQERLERSTETLPTPPAQPRGAVPGEACLVHIYPRAPGMGRCLLMGDAAVLIGRGADCDIVIDDHAVSRRHARIEPAGGGHCAIDLDSTNGTFVNGTAVHRHQLADGDYLRVGHRIYRYLAGGNVEAEYHEEIYRLTIIDALTEIANKRCLLEFLTRELARAGRHRRPLALLLFDIDRFKVINDTHGHLCGDHVLSELAACVRPVIRAEELFARYGGEEFAIVLPECNAEGAVAAGERLRALVEAHAFRFQDKPVPVTISVGVAVVNGDDSVSAADLIQRADKKLYEAKRAGRNRVVI